MSNTFELRRLARRAGLQVSFFDVHDRMQHSSPEAILAALRELGMPLERVDEAPDASRRCHQQRWQRVLEPVVVAWDGLAEIRLRLPVERCRGRFECRVELEQHLSECATGKLEDLPVIRRRDVEGTAYAVVNLRVPQKLPPGYHRLTLETPSGTHEALLLSAPIRAFSRESAEARRRWGLFVPLYALHGKSSWGAGDLSDLERLLQWVSGAGGGIVATLPMLSWLSEIGADPSPYSPASRLFWNEFYLDVTRVPELETCESAQADLAAESTRQRLARLRENPHVDYNAQMRVKRELLEPLARSFFRGEGSREEFENFRQRHPDLDAFARFRAVGERRGVPWTEWPERLQAGQIGEDDFDADVFRYHQYTQWQVARQLESLADQARRQDMLWYLDFPLGVSTTGYDVWRNQDLFALGACGGAPPDAFFSKGQNWGFPPLRPDRLREQGYRYFIQSLRRHFEHAQLLRIDHVMSLYRLYWVPNGLGPGDGVYVRYPADELFAILVIESHRHQAEIVGENLGTVPEVVNRRLDDHHIREMYVGQSEAKLDADPVLRDVPSFSVASLNTHDMPPFTSFWTGLDVDDRVDLELLDSEGASEERENRSALRLRLADFLRDQGLLDQDSLDPNDVLEGLLSWLASSQADVVLVNLEDLWEETQMQNMPGTYLERPNWRRKLRYPFEEFRQLPQVLHALETVNRQRASAPVSAAGQT